MFRYSIVELLFSYQLRGYEVKSFPFYFGCKSPQYSGHYLFDHSGRQFPYSQRPFSFGIDGTILKEQNIPDVPGNACYTQKEGYSIVAFWDRSCDSRSGSNSAFIIYGDFTAQEVINEAKCHFSGVFSRQLISYKLPDGTVLF